MNNAAAHEQLFPDRSMYIHERGVHRAHLAAFRLGRSCGDYGEKELVEARLDPLPDNMSVEHQHRGPLGSLAPRLPSGSRCAWAG